jgi:hypothetical protein
MKFLLIATLVVASASVGSAGLFDFPKCLRSLAKNTTDSANTLIKNTLKELKALEVPGAILETLEKVRQDFEKAVSEIAGMQLGDLVQGAMKIMISLGSVVNGALDGLRTLVSSEEVKTLLGQLTNDLFGIITDTQKQALRCLF